MIAAWMLHAAFTGLVLAAAALVLDRVAGLLGRPARWLWAAGLGASLVIPALGLAVAGHDPRAAGAPAGSSAAPGAAGGAEAAVVDAWLAELLARAELGVTADSGWRRLDAPLTAGWALLTLAAALWGAAGMVRLRRARREWTPAVVEGVPVLVAGRTGPALAGLLRPRVVLPEWALASEPAELRLMLAHEREHERAGDPWLLAVAAAAVALCPWNPALWWQLRRLRLAVEIDCDSRVLRRHPDVRRYGALLLAVGRRVAGPRLPLAALGTPPATLERRIRTMTTPRPLHARFRAAVLGAAGIALAVAACEVPRPTEVAPEHTIALADLTSGEGFAPSATVTIERVRAAIAQTMPADQRAARTGAARDIWLVADAGGKLLRAEIQRASRSALALSGSPAELNWSDSTSRVAVRRPRMSGGRLTAELAPESIESIEVLKLAPGVVIADSANVVWVRLKEGATLGSAAAARTATPAADAAPKIRISGAELPSVASDAAGSGVRVRADSGLREPPMFIVDGEELQGTLGPTGVLDFPIPPDSIASVEVLKGAAAEKAYGARGARGVVVITTKRPSKRP